MRTTEISVVIRSIVLSYRIVSQAALLPSLIQAMLCRTIPFWLIGSSGQTTLGRRRKTLVSMVRFVYVSTYRTRPLAGSAGTIFLVFFYVGST